VLVAQGAFEFRSASRQPNDLLAAPNAANAGFPELQGLQLLDRAIAILARIRLPKRGEKNDSLQHGRYYAHGRMYERSTSIVGAELVMTACNGSRFRPGKLWDASGFKSDAGISQSHACDSPACKRNSSR
jgi:hypothetical protein